jgi:thiamine pyrophosphokinase
MQSVDAGASGPAADHDQVAVIFTGGDPVPPAALPVVPVDAFVIAADSGLHHVDAGRRVDLVIGDFDSVESAALDAAALSGAAVERHPEAKDQTDLDLALRAARRRGFTRVVVVGGYGGRADHFLANALLLGSADFVHLAITAYVGAARIIVVRSRADLDGRPGELCSLLAVGGPARAVRTTGLLYPLEGEDLLPGSSRGVSNQLIAPAAAVTIAAGTLLAVQPQFGGT